MKRCVGVGNDDNDGGRLIVSMIRRLPAGDGPRKASVHVYVE